MSDTNKCVRTMPAGTNFTFSMQLIESAKITCRGCVKAQQLSTPVFCTSCQLGGLYWNETPSFFRVGKFVEERKRIC